MLLGGIELTTVECKKKVWKILGHVMRVTIKP
jgi:hypothetical protein